jgi:magnesium-transporting ATPase (P-type)
LIVENAYRTVAVAYKEIDDLKIEEGDPRASYRDWLSRCTEEYLEKDLTLIAIAGIKDPIRPDVP